MKQILPKLEEINKHLTFAKKSFTKGGFRHFTAYIDGLITLNKNTVKQISKASLEENHHSGINRVLTEAKFEQELLERKYLKKIFYITKGQKVSLILDDTLAEHNGKKIEETQSHKDHSSDSFITGHQFFTAIIHTELMQMPLFPKLYSKNTDSKIEMAKDTIDFIYMQNYMIDDEIYKVKSLVAKLNGIPHVRVIISREWDESKKKWGKKFHLISTNTQDTPVQIIRHYRIRWCIETYHRDIKQNLGFAAAFFRKKEGIVRHAIFSTLAYAILKLFMLCRGLVMTIGECCGHIQDKGMDNFIREIVEIEDTSERIDYFEKVFIRKSAKV